MYFFAEKKLSLIENIDKTLLSFNLSSNITVKHHSTKTISILSTGHEHAFYCCSCLYG